MIDDRDYYLDTLARMEPDIASIDTAAGWASSAISLKRIADTLGWFKGLVIGCTVLYWVIIVVRAVVVDGVLQ